MGTEQPTPPQPQQPALAPPSQVAIDPVQMTNATVPVNSTPVAAPTDQSTPQDLSYHPQGFLGHIFSPFVNAIGHGTQYVPQSDGTIQQVATKATPGNMFKTMLAGALSGLASAAQHPGQSNSLGGGLGLGFAGGAENAEHQDEMAREQAVQSVQMKQKAQQLADAHTSSDNEQKLMAQQVLEANAHTAAYSMQLHTLSQEAQDKVFQMGKESLDRAIADHGEVVGPYDMTFSQLQAYQSQNPAVGHEAKAYITGETPELDASGKPVQEVVRDSRGNALLDPDTHNPVMSPKMHYTYTLVKPAAQHTVTTEDLNRLKKNGVTALSDEGVKPGNTVSGAHWLSLSDQAYQNQLKDVTLQAEKAKQVAAMATAQAENERARG